MATPALAPIPETQTDNPFLANLNKREIPSLYGLRGIAALVVVCSHFSSPTPAVRYFPAGYAVGMFFILSGLLITWLLLKEFDKTGSIHFKQFYARRSLRLFPAFYAIWAVGLLTLHSMPSKWATFFYMCDYYLAFGAPFDQLTQAWSLGVEEKFYLLWPLCLRRIHRDKLLYCIPLVIIADQVWRQTIKWRSEHYAAFAFDTNLDCILIGCYIALLAHRGIRFPRWLGSSIIPLVAIPGIYMCGETTVHYLLAVLLIWAIIRQPWALNNPIARYLGLISYSLYLCHLITQTVVWEPLLGSIVFPRWSLQLASKIAVALVCASALHFGIERPFLRLKNRFHARN